MGVVELIEAELARRGISCYKLEWYHDPDWGQVYAVEVCSNAREALELWLGLARLIPHTEHGVVVGVRWLGENDVSKDELANYLARIMVESGLRTKAVEPLDVVRELWEERDRR
jgi:hypothetical protein